MSIKEYKTRVSAAARERNGSPIFNGSVEHARVIVENMFSHAHNRIDIISSALNARVYGSDEVVEQAKLFLAPMGRELNILIEDDRPGALDSHPLFQAIGDLDSVNIRVAPKNIADLYKFNFLVMDGDSYRFEADKTKCVAVATWGDRAGAERIKSIFDAIWPVCGEYEQALEVA